MAHAVHRYATSSALDTASTGTGRSDSCTVSFSPLPWLSPCAKVVRQHYTITLEAKKADVPQQSDKTNATAKSEKPVPTPSWTKQVIQGTLASHPGGPVNSHLLQDCRYSSYARDTDTQHSTLNIEP